MQREKFRRWIGLLQRDENGLEWVCKWFPFFCLSVYASRLPMLISVLRACAITGFQHRRWPTRRARM